MPWVRPLANAPGPKHNCNLPQVAALLRRNKGAPLLPLTWEIHEFPGQVETGRCDRDYDELAEVHPTIMTRIIFHLTSEKFQLEECVLDLHDRQLDLEDRHVRDNYGVEDPHVAVLRISSTGGIATPATAVPQVNCPTRLHQGSERTSGWSFV